MESGPLPIHVRRCLDACEGWVALGDLTSAKEELDAIAALFQSEPDVLRVRLELHFAMSDWEEVVRTARKLCVQIPTNAYPYLRCAYALHELKRTQEAWDVLRPIAEDESHGDDWVIPYNLACYAAQMGQLAEARKWLEKAYEIGDVKVVKPQAMEDPDLAPLWKAGETD